MGNPQKRKKREKRAKKKLARKRQHSATGVARVPSTPPPKPSSLTTAYADPNTLATFGPVVKASWSVPAALAQHLRKLNRDIPKPISGLILIDTGASRTCMAVDVAAELQLTPVGLGKTYGSGGLHENEVFEALLALNITDSFGQKTVIRHQGQIMGIPDLGKQLARLGMQAEQGETKRLIGLLGRDMLRYATLTYRGSKGTVEVAFDLDALPSAPGPKT